MASVDFRSCATCAEYFKANLRKWQESFERVLLLVENAVLCGKTVPVALVVQPLVGFGFTSSQVWFGLVGLVS